MNKIIIHPGNGIDFPKQGDYVKLNLIIYDTDKNKIFDSKLFSEEKCMEIRYRCPESNVLTVLEDLIGEMSLFEKCLLIVDKSCENCLIESELIRELANKNKEIMFEVEVVDINENSYY
jgi:hypothetical protein